LNNKTALYQALRKRYQLLWAVGSHTWTDTGRLTTSGWSRTQTSPGRS
jgi:hypothetical protein